MLSEILLGFMWADYEGETFLKVHPGETMVKVIEFFLSHGFDVHKNNDRYGAQCLGALAYSTYDNGIIAAAKLLFDAGAMNVSMSDEDDNLPYGYIETESSCENICENDYHSGNIFEAVCQIYIAVDEGRPYQGIDSYQVSLGKQLIKVLAEKQESGNVFFDMDIPPFKHDNCFRTALYFVYDGGVLINSGVSRLWTDTVLPQETLTDVSYAFQSIVGSVIERIEFDHNEIRTEQTTYTSLSSLFKWTTARKQFSILTTAKLKISIIHRFTH